MNDANQQRFAITDLPADVLYTIFPYLSAADFLSFTNCSREFFPYRQDPAFWHALTRQTFRVPEQPLLQSARWQWLYKKLLTQTRLYTWGNNTRGNLGHGMRMGMADVGNGWPSRLGGWPGEPVLSIDVGIISDVQCGGWSTTMLNSIGEVYMFGVFDGIRFRNQGSSSLQRLQFPPGHAPTTRERYEPSTAIKQLSTGRSSALGLSDDGTVWSWCQDVAVLVKSASIDMMEEEITRVNAGWDRMSMYVRSRGIVYWPVAGQQQLPAMADGPYIEMVTIPGTGYRRRSRDSRASDESLESRIGEILHYVVLEAHIVFTTHLNKIFSYPTTIPTPSLNQPLPVELTTFYTAIPQPFHIRDLQGSFNNFALFTEPNAILTAKRPLLDSFHQSPLPSPQDLPEPTLLPALQSPSIISLSFGDHHYHALHRNGTLTSHGIECQQCGSLGLGFIHRSPFRGVTPIRGVSGDSHLPPHSPPRTIWFEPLMDVWLQAMCDKSVEGEAKERGDLIRTSDERACEASGEYFEREGRKWEGRDGNEDDEMGAYFVLKVASAGWHSAALVLVDEEKAQRARDRHVLSSPSSPGDDDGDTHLATTAAPDRDRESSTDSFEYIDSPSEQLAKAVYEAYSWCVELVRWFLGLRERDARRAAGGAGTGSTGGAVNAGGRLGATTGRDGGNAKGEGAAVVRYTWDEQPFPRLKMRGGEVMPGTGEVVDVGL